MHNFDYIAIMDLDELLVPAAEFDVPSLLDNIKAERAKEGKITDSFRFKSLMYPPTQTETEERYRVSMICKTLPHTD